MTRLIKKISKTAGLVPGTLVHVGEKKAERLRITIFDYDEKQFREKETGTVGECFPFKDTSTVTWMNVDGIHDVGDGLRTTIEGWNGREDDRADLGGVRHQAEMP